MFTVRIYSEYLVNKWYAQRHTLRDRRPSTAACLGDGGKGIVIVYGEEKNILYWAD